MQPIVSVILLTYNQESTVDRAIESVLSQKCEFPFEIVVSDDCSTDGTREVCHRYATEYPDVVRLLPASPNKGLVNNYFETLLQCRGRYIADCAGDDYWVGNDRLQRQCEVLESDAGISMVHAGWLCVDAVSGKAVPSDPQHLNSRLHQPVMDGRNLLLPLLRHSKPYVVHLSTVLYRAGIIRRTMSAERSMVWNCDFGCEDYPVLAALFAGGKVAYIDTPVLAYTVGGDSVSSDRDMRRNAEFHLRTSFATVSLARYYGVPLCLLRTVLAQKMGFALSQAYHLGDAQLRRKIHGVKQENGIPVGHRYMFLRIVTSCRPLWRMVHAVHRLVKGN